MSESNVVASRTVQLHPSMRGFVSAVVNAQLRQRAFLQVKAPDGSTLASATFEGQGTRVHMKDVFNNREHWSFGPFDYNATLHITISNYTGGKWVESKMVGPLSIHKRPEPDYPMEFYVSTVISEDGHDQSHDDCTVTVLQYK